MDISTQALHGFYYVAMQVIYFVCFFLVYGTVFCFFICLFFFKTVVNCYQVNLTQSCDFIFKRTFLLFIFLFESFIIRYYQTFLLFSRVVILISRYYTCLCSCHSIGILSQCTSNFILPCFNIPRSILLHFVLLPAVTTQQLESLYILFYALLGYIQLLHSWSKV